MELESRKGVSKTLILIIVVMFLSGTVMGYGVFKLLDKDNDKEYSSSDMTIEKESEKEEENSLLYVDIDDNIRDLYYKYHSSDKRVSLTSMTIEKRIYSSNKFEIKSIEDDEVTNTFAMKIYESSKNELEKYAKYNDYNAKYYDESDVENIIKKSFNELFGDNLSFSHKVMSGCNILHYNDGKYYYDVNCGDTSGQDADFKLVMALKDNNNMYLYEIVNTYMEGLKEETLASELYKWTYSKGSDDNYYFLKAERVNQSAIDEKLLNELKQLGHIEEEMFSSSNRFLEVEGVVNNFNSSDKVLLVYSYANKKGMSESISCDKLGVSCDGGNNTYVAISKDNFNKILKLYGITGNFCMKNYKYDYAGCWESNDYFVCTDCSGTVGVAPMESINVEYNENSIIIVDNISFTTGPYKDKIVKLKYTFNKNIDGDYYLYSVYKVK